MTPNEAFESQLKTQIGEACMTIAKQAAAVTELQNTIQAKDQEIAALKAELDKLKTP